MNAPFQCVLHGSFRKHFDEIKRTRQLFGAAGIEVIAPKRAEIAAYEAGFAKLEGETGADPRLIELEYLQHLRRLGPNGFSFFVNPEGYIGRSAAYELGIAQAVNVPCFFSAPPRDLPVYAHRNAVRRADDLAQHITTHRALPGPDIRTNERLLHRLWEQLLVPGSVVAAGGIIEYADAQTSDTEREILLVKTHKWGGRYSIVGGKVRQRERLKDALVREIREETDLAARPVRHLCTFDQFRDSGYYKGGVNHIFVDYVVQVDRKSVRLNEEAQEYVWLPAREALRDLPLEPNARHTVEHYLETAR